MNDVPFDGFVVLSTALSVLRAVLAIAVVFFFLKWLDKRSGYRFAATRDKIDDDSVALGVYYGLRFLGAAVIAGAVFGSFLALVVITSTPAAAQTFPDRYDSSIQKAVERYWPDFPFWRAWKAQLYQESRLDPDVCSYVGACGVAQFMPRTWTAITQELGWEGVSPHDAKYAIEAGAYYMAQLRKGWKSKRSEIERHRLAQASYNAGFGNIAKAQARCGGAPLWDDVKVCLHLVTGRHHKETIGYVDRIARWWRMMEAG